MQEKIYTLMCLNVVVDLSFIESNQLFLIVRCIILLCRVTVLLQFFECTVYILWSKFDFRVTQGSNLGPLHLPSIR